MSPTCLCAVLLACWSGTEVTKLASLLQSLCEKRIRMQGRIRNRDPHAAGSWVWPSIPSSRARGSTYQVLWALPLPSSSHGVGGLRFEGSGMKFICSAGLKFTSMLCRGAWKVRPRDEGEMSARDHPAASMCSRRDVLIQGCFLSMSSRSYSGTSREASARVAILMSPEVVFLFCV